jgi:hypothetical protein
MLIATGRKEQRLAANGEQSAFKGAERKVNRERTGLAGASSQNQLLS